MKKLCVLFVVFSVAVTGLCCFALVSSIQNYLSPDMGYEDLIYKELTYDRYELVKRRWHIYERVVGCNAYFQEYDEPIPFLEADLDEIDFDALDKVSTNETVRVYITTDYAPAKEYVICEMTTDSDVILSFSDHTAIVNENQFAGIIICSVMMPVCIFVIILSVMFCIRVKKEKENLLGKLIIEYKKDENTICIYKAIKACSLVINGKTVDERRGLISGLFSLMGTVADSEGNKAYIIAERGLVFMRLYYNGEEVTRKIVL